MESLAVKYRPALLDDLIGQEQVVDIIKGMLGRNGINRTLMIYGPWGSGKTSTARLIASYLNCTDKVDLIDPPCGRCRACVEMQDYTEINAAESRGIDTVRGLIDQANYMPASNTRVVVLDEAHQLTSQAVQALLKITEEPPAETLFILCTTDPQRFPPALKSRCLQLNIAPLTAKDTVRVLQRIVEGEDLDRTLFTEELLTAITVAVNAVPRNAIMVLETMLNAIHGQGEIPDPAAFATKLARDVVGHDPEGLCVQILRSLYRGKYTPALLALQHVQNPMTFMDLLVRFHRHAVYHRASPKLRDPIMHPWYEELDKAEKLDIERLTKINGVLLEGLMLVRTNPGEAPDILFNQVLKAAGT